MSQFNVTVAQGRGARGASGESGLAAMKGDWVTGTLYPENSWVYHAKSGYGKCAFRALLEHISGAASEPVVGASRDTYWEEGPEGGQNGEVIMDGTPAEHDIMIRGSLDKHVETSGIQLETTLTPASDVKAPTSKAVADYVAGLAFTDVQVPIVFRTGFISNTSGAANGTLTLSEASVVQSVARTASLTGHWIRSDPINIPFRTTALKGYKLVSITVSYVLGLTDTSADDLEVHVLKQVMGSNGNAPTAAVLAGDADADYDANHDTKAKRLGAASHTAVVTIPEGERAFMASGEEYSARLFIDEAAGPAMTCSIYQAYATLEAVPL